MSDIKGMDRLLKRLRALPAEERKEVDSAIASSALLVQGAAQRSLQKGPKSGRTYRKGAIKRRGNVIGYKFHRASAPGEPPASDTGQLVSNINIRHEADSMEATVGVHDVKGRVPYARRLELGGRDKRGVYIAPRPYMRPALRKNGERIIRMITNAVKKAVKDSGRG